MSGLIIQDGRRSGHMGWCRAAIRQGSASGVIISPFCSPLMSLPRHPAGYELRDSAVAEGGEAIFDASTHARLLPGTNKLDHYNTWDLWGPDGVGLDTAQRRLQHLQLVFARQQALSVPPLTPTLALDSPTSLEARFALATARAGSGLTRGAWQSLAARRSFWRSGPQLDAYIGQLAALRAPVWIITLVNEIVPDHVPDLADVDAFEGLSRSIRSLSYRSRVIVANFDFGGLPLIAAGADTLGTGWDRGMRFFDPLSFRLASDDSPRIPASYVTQGGLAAVLRRDTADAIERLQGVDSDAIRGGTMPVSDRDEKFHHLRVLQATVARIDQHSSSRDRVAELFAFYEVAEGHFDTLIERLPRVVRQVDKLSWNSRPSDILRAYALGEGF